MFIEYRQRQYPKPQRGDMYIMFRLRHPNQKHISDYTRH